MPKGTTITLTIPASMMPDIRKLKDDDETLEDCIIDLMWIGVMRVKSIGRGCPDDE